MLATFRARGDVSQVVPTQSCLPRDLRQHSWPNFVAIVEGEHVIEVSRAFENSVRTRLTLDGPADSQQRR
jgi:hypothetical protein